MAKVDSKIMGKFEKLRLSNPRPPKTAAIIRSQVPPRPVDPTILQQLAQYVERARQSAGRGDLLER
jgi:hypothetical protein